MAQPPPPYPPPPTQGGYYPPPPQGYPPTDQAYPPPAQAYGPQGYAPPTQGYPPPPVTQQPGQFPPQTQQYYPPPQQQQQQQQQTQPPPDQNWAPAPPRPLDCPPGLEYLCQIDQLIVKQKVEMLEAFLGFETKNKYKIKNSMGQQVYKAKEDVDCCTRNLCGPIRPFDMVIKDNYDTEVIHLSRPLNCQSCFFPCCLQYLEVQSPPGTVIGSVEQQWSILSPSFTVNDANGNVVLRIEGPVCTFSLCGDVEFKVLTEDGETEVGKISKQWSGVLREAFTDSDNFGISFPMDLDVKCKATLLGALFLIDYMFFEKKGNEESDGIGMF